MSNIVADAKKIRILFVPAELIDPVNKLSQRTILRCQKALEYWRTYEYDYLAVSGGIFLPRDVQTVSAGQLMMEWFREQNVDPNRMIVEIYSLDTYENIRNTVATMQMGWDLDPERCEITVVTQWQHARRFAISFRMIFGIKIKVIPVDYPMSLIERLKEFIFIFIHLVDPWGVSPVARLNRRMRLQAITQE